MGAIIALINLSANHPVDALVEVAAQRTQGVLIKSYSSYEAAIQAIRDGSFPPVDTVYIQVESPPPPENAIPGSAASLITTMKAHGINAEIVTCTSGLCV